MLLACWPQGCLDFSPLKPEVRDRVVIGSNPAKPSNSAIVGSILNCKGFERKLERKKAHRTWGLGLDKQPTAWDLSVGHIRLRA